MPEGSTPPRARPRTAHGRPADRPGVSLARLPDGLASPYAKLVYLYVRTYGIVAPDELKAALDVDLLTLFPVLEALIERGLVERVDGGFRCAVGVPAPSDGPERLRPGQRLVPAEGLPGPAATVGASDPPHPGRTTDAAGTTASFRPVDRESASGDAESIPADD